MSSVRRVLVTGAGGFIGSHLTEYLKEKGYWVRGVDLKYPEFDESAADEFEILDLRLRDEAMAAVNGVDEVYALAADMGGMGFISSHHAEILYNNSLINLHTIEAARIHGVDRYLYTSSACIYPEHLQTEANVRPLKESDAYPAAPQDAYGWEKLISERLCTHYRDDYGLDTRIIRFHNIFGEKGTWQGGREKAPAALCRKIAIAKLSGEAEIEIWGDGEQTRSFCYIDDCVEGLYRLMRSDFTEPLNLGQDRMISINALADIIAKIAGIEIIKKHVDGPMGVRGRNSDNSKLRDVLEWEPAISLEEGLKTTFEWIYGAVVGSSTVSRSGGRSMTGDQQLLTKTALVIPVFNRKETTLQALRSLRKIRTDGLDVRIFVVDDGSTDGTSDAIKAGFPEVQLEFGDGTLHYAAGTNRGIEAALKWKADLIVTMNDDSIFHEEFLVRLVETSRRFERSIVGSSLLQWDKPHLTFQIAPEWSSIKGGWIFPHNKPIFSFPSEPYPVECIVGNCVLFPAAAIKEMGLMDEVNFPNGWGDAQYTTQMKKAGWQLIIDPGSKVWCEPNTYPDPLHTLALTERLRILWKDQRHPANLVRQFKALWYSAPSKPAAVVAFACYVGGLGLKAINVLPLAART